MIIVPAKYIDELKSAPEETASVIRYLDDVRGFSKLSIPRLNAPSPQSSLLLPTPARSRSVQPNFRYFTPSDVIFVTRPRLLTTRSGGGTFADTASRRGPFIVEILF
jgi:hypothetical protein